MPATIAIIERVALDLRMREQTRAAKTLEDARDLLVATPHTRQPLVLAALALKHPALLILFDGENAAQRKQAASEILKLAKDVAYPSLPVSLQARLVLGEPPAALAPGLTAAEAHTWLAQMSKYPLTTRDPVWWLAEHLGLEDAAVVRSIPVVRWLATVFADPARRDALTRVRSMRLPHGDIVSMAYRDRVDELHPRDLCESVTDTFARCAQRLHARLERELATQHEPLAPKPTWWQPIHCASLLNTGAALLLEGRTMKHCVAVYSERVRRRECVILSIQVLDQRSTVELSPDGQSVYQHRGPLNLDPHPLCVAALEVCLRRWRKPAAPVITLNPNQTSDQIYATSTTGGGG
jgi:hypothetical protein